MSRTMGMCEAAAGPSRREPREYRWIYAATLPLFIFVAARDRLFGPAPPAGESRGSLMREARKMAHSSIPFAYMH